MLAFGITEVLDSEGKHVKKGGMGEILVTGFWNFAMPFVGYRTGDLTIFDGDESENTLDLALTRAAY